MSTVAELENKIEEELRKPANERNRDLLTFWERRLPAPQSPAPAPGNYLIIIYIAFIIIFTYVYNYRIINIIILFLSLLG